MNNSKPKHSETIMEEIKDKAVEEIINTEPTVELKPQKFSPNENVKIIGNIKKDMNNNDIKLKDNSFTILSVDDETKVNIAGTDGIYCIHPAYLELK